MMTPRIFVHLQYLFPVQIVYVGTLSYGKQVSLKLSKSLMILSQSLLVYVPDDN